MTPSDLIALDGCFRYFHWTRLLGLADPARRPTGDTPQMRLGSLAHKVMESATLPDVELLKAQGLQDLQAVFASDEWRALPSSSVERELPFIMNVRAAGHDCFVRGRMDAVIPGNPPRVVDYKFSLWRDDAESTYEIQMTAYSLAVMKSLGVNRAIAELWYLKAPMKVLRHEYTLEEAEHRISGILERYMESLKSGAWPMADRTYCDAMECGFRDRCWGV
jgi:CRISPR/Cas system-associated exonuclease Cas4 (RecB family)